VRADAEKFSPAFRQSVNFSIDSDAAGVEGIVSWVLHISRNGFWSTNWQLQGDGIPPAELQWGLGFGDGTFVKDGNYSFVMELKYADGHVLKTVPGFFAVDASAPVATLSASPDGFTPDGDGVDDLLEIRLRIADQHELAGWVLLVRDSQGVEVRRFSGRHAPEAPLRWDGRYADGTMLESSSVYYLECTAVDELGNASTPVTAKISSGLAVRQSPEGLLLTLSTLEFGHRSAVLLPHSLVILKQLARMLDVYSSYRVSILVHVHDRAEDERANLELSEQRAKAVASALAGMGVRESRIKARGVGSTLVMYDGGHIQHNRRNNRTEIVLQPE